MGVVVAPSGKSKLLGELHDESAPQETCREGIEVIRTFCTSSGARPVAKVVYGYAYRCIKCNGIWLHRMQSFRHECPGITVLGL